MWAAGMSETAIRRALGLSEWEAVAHGIIWSRSGQRGDEGPGSARGIAAGIAAGIAEETGEGVSGRAENPKDSGAQDTLAGPSMAAVLTVVARQSGLSEALLLSPVQTRRPAQARQLVMCLLRALCPGATLPAIGHFLGRDHSTVLHGCRRAQARRKSVV